jgi:hypothetical protein
MNIEQKKLIASIYNTVAMAQFGVVGYAAFVSNPVNILHLLLSIIEFFFLEGLAYATLSGDDNGKT